MTEDASRGEFHVALAKSRSKHRITVPDEIRQQVLGVQPGDNLVFYTLEERVCVDSLATVLPRLLQAAPADVPYQLEGLPDLPPITEVIAELSKGGRTVQELVDLLRSFRGCTEQVAMLGMMLLLYELEARLGSKWVREFLLILFLLELVPRAHQTAFVRALHALCQDIPLRRALMEGYIS